jgi:predicted dithiol-disulfide oxidoreductase (DUF899 family)
MIADAFNGSAVHLANHDVMLWAVSRAPLSKLQAYRRRMGWTFPWASSQGGDFNFDFNVSITEEQQREGADYNYRREPPTSDVFRWRAGQEGGGNSAEARLAAMSGTDVPGYHRDRPGMSAFALEDGAVYHTYSTYARGVDPFFGVYHWLDRAPKGRNEAGVSTLIKCIMGVIRPEGGQVYLERDGERIDLVGRWSPEEIVQLGVSLVPEGRRLFPKLTLEENLLLGAYRPAARQAIARNLAFCFEAFPVLYARRRQLAGSISGGEQRRCSRSAAPSCRPRRSCSSTSRRWASRPSSSAASSRRSRS